MMIAKTVKFLLILMIFSSNSYAAERNRNQEKIDFWTNTIDEIFLHFRYNKFTHDLEMSEGSSEESQQDNLEHTQNSDNKLANNKPLEILQDSKDKSEKSAEVIENGKNSSTKSENKSKFDNENLEKSITSISEQQPKSETTMKATDNDKKSVSSISENDDDDSITAVKDDFIDIDLNKGLKSIDLSAVRSELPKQRGHFSSTNEHYLSIDSCALNCSNIPHIACGHNWTFSPQCSHNAKLINLNNLQALIVQQHNRLRNELAGHMTQFEPAARMGTTQWHSELAAYAQLNAMTCNDEHDFCHNTKEFKVTGQNLAYHTWSGRKNDLAEIIIHMINDWYSENAYAKQSDLDKFHRIIGSDNEFIAHFTNVVNERNTRIGCAAVAEKKGRWNTIYFTCNYARNNIYDLPIYEKGPTASKCLTGVNPEYPNLCSISEEYEYNI